MKRILLDTNVVLDVLLDRQPFVDASAAVWNAVETRAAAGFLPAHAVTTVHYLLRKEKGNAKARLIVSNILSVFGVAKVDGTVIQAALQLGCSDFEDAVSAAAASSAGCDFIVTRDPKGFRDSLVQVLTPEAVLPLLLDPN
jgi:predicted nucleic acid-binding protein